MGHKRRPKRLSDKLLQIREALGLSQGAMAERLTECLAVEMSHKKVSQYERGKTLPPMEVVLAYARVANVQMEQILDDDLVLPHS